MTTARGFILQSTYRIATRPDGLRVPVIHCYGRFEDGHSFLIRDDRQRPYFFIRAADAASALAAGAPAPVHCDWRTFDGAPTCRIEAAVPGDVPGVRDRLHALHIETFEADVRFAQRYLIERGIKGGCAIEGVGTRGDGVDWVFDNPAVHSADVTLVPRVLSFDIETAGRAERLLAIALHAPGLDSVLVVDGSDRVMPPGAIRCVNEYAALDAFCAQVRGCDPDVLTGWNVIDFDLAVLQRIAARVRHPLTLGRGEGALRVRKAEGYFGSGHADVPGRLVLDGIDLLRGAFIRMDDYSLDTVAREVLGEGKALSGDVHDRIGEITQNYRHDLPAFVHYARTDARLAWQILERLTVVRLAFARSRLTGMTPDRVGASIASFDFLYLGELARRRVVAPSVAVMDPGDFSPQQGGQVLESVAGLHPQVWVFDFKSLYPSIIRTFNIDPLSFCAEPEAGHDLIVTPAGAFRREPAILPRLLDELFPRRDAAKRDGDAVAAHAVKILMNSCYGVLGTPACRFYNPHLAGSITAMGREILMWSRNWFEAAGFRVLYGDTDSLFVLSHGGAAAEVQDLGQQLAAQLNRALETHVATCWRVASRLELKFEKLYLQLFLPRMRHSERGASKRYVGERHGAPPGEIEFVGMEVVRRDWTALAKQVQRELYQRLFAGEAVAAYLTAVVRDLRGGALDAALIYRKNLRKDAGEYTATSPPHVVAARKSTQGMTRLVSYVISTAGPEPTDNIRHPLDREHYVQKQVRPVAEPVLQALGLDFDQVIGDERQFDLYPAGGPEPGV
jgi:DNA polymerase-2